MSPKAEDVKSVKSPSGKKTKFVIESVIRRDKLKAEPILGTFLNGKPRKAGHLKGRLLQNNTNNVRYQHHRLFGVETTQLSYVGKNFGTDAATPIKESVFLGILNKETGKMQLVEMSNYTLHPRLSNVNEENPDVLHANTYSEKQEKVLLAFGSKKAKKAFKQAQISKVDTEGMGGAIHQASTDVQLTEEDLHISSEHEESYLALLPECDRKASSPEGVYKLELIAPDDFLCYYKEMGRKFLNNELNFDDTYTSLTKEIVAIAKFEPEDESQIRYVCLALYVEHLIRFSRQRISQIKKEIPGLEDCPDDIKKYIVNTYTSGKARMFSAIDKDRVFCCALVLALIGCKFEIFTTTALESLQIQLKKLHLLMKAIGATYMKENYSFKLKFPLTRIAKSHKMVAKSMKKGL